MCVGGRWGGLGGMWGGLGCGGEVGRVGRDVGRGGVMSKFAIKRKDTTLMVFDLILSPTLNLALALAL